MVPRAVVSWKRDETGITIQLACGHALRALNSELPPGYTDPTVGRLVPCQTCQKESDHADV